MPLIHGSSKSNTLVPYHHLKYKLRLCSKAKWRLLLRLQLILAFQGGPSFWGGTFRQRKRSAIWSLDLTVNFRIFKNVLSNQAATTYLIFSQIRSMKPEMEPWPLRRVLFYRGAIAIASSLEHQAHGLDESSYVWLINLGQATFWSSSVKFLG